jgi:DNA-binding transcriptional ArsR family regulator
MSLEAMAYVKTLEITKPAEKLILLLLADRISNETGECFPGQKRLAKEASMSERTVRRHMKKLGEAGMIISRKRFCPNGNPNTSAYEIVGFLDWLNCAEKCADDQRSKVTSGQHRPAVKSGSTTGQNVQSPADNVVLQTQRDNPQEPKDDGKLDLPEVPKPKSHIDEAVALYRETAKELGLPDVRKLNDERRSKLRLRLKDHGLDGWREAMQALRDSSHCQGENNRGWRANLDFVLQESSMLKLLEGVYADKEKVGKNRAIPDDTLVKYCVEYGRNPDFWSPKLEQKIGPPPGNSGCKIKQWVIDRAREILRSERQSLNGAAYA